MKALQPLMRPAFLAAALAFAATPALADGPITTAAGDSAPQASSSPPPPLAAQGQGGGGDPPATRLGPCGPQAVDANGKPNMSPHGDVSVGVGTGGYRSAAVQVCKPVGDDSALEIGVGDAQVNGWGGRR